MNIARVLPRRRRQSAAIRRSDCSRSCRRSCAAAPRTSSWRSGARSIRAASISSSPACAGGARFADELDAAPHSAARMQRHHVSQRAALAQQARLARHIARRRIDIVHAYSFYGNVFAMPPARLAGGRSSSRRFAIGRRI